jgi:hypothetical protein
MSENTTTRCTLALPIGTPEIDRITVTIRDLPSDSDDGDPDMTEIVIDVGGRTIKTAFIGLRDTALIDSDGGTVIFPSIDVAVAHMMLEQLDASDLRLPMPKAARWDALHHEKPQKAWIAAGGIEEYGYQGAWEMRGLWHTANDTAELAAAIEAADILGSNLRWPLADAVGKQRLFDPDRYKFDSAREHSGGSGKPA